MEARNQADTLIYSTEKSLKDLGDKIDQGTQDEIKAAIEPLRKAMEGDDAEEIKRLSEALTQASHKLAEAMYQQASQEGAQGPGTGPEGGPGAQPNTAPPDDDVVDADFEEVNEDKK